MAKSLVAEFARSPSFATLRQAFTQLLAKSLRPLGEGIEMPDDLPEMTLMLESRFGDWEQQTLQRGRQEGLQAGRQEGRQEGWQEGRHEGEAALMARLLERRFGPLPAWAQERIIGADTNALEEWALRVLDATSLDQVFT